MNLSFINFNAIHPFKNWIFRDIEDYLNAKV